MLSREAVAWAGGLFEGEGTFTKGRSQRQPAATIKMTDLDSLERFAGALGFGHVRGPYHREDPKHKDFWIWSAQSFEKYQATVAMLWPFLCSRRKARAAELLRGARSMPLQHGSEPACPKCGGSYTSGSNGHNRRGEPIVARRCRPCQYEQQRAWKKRTPQGVGWPPGC